MECEYRNEKGECYFGWTDCNTLESILSNVKFAERMRVKPEPKYRPYNGADEFVKASQEHGEWLKEASCDNQMRFKSIYCDGAGVAMCNGANRMSFWNFYDDMFRNFVWVDGSPCGAVEE